MELKDTASKPKKKYSYQFMNKDKVLFFRYDNSEHHPELPGFPHHKHTQDKIMESLEPNLEDVLIEIYTLRYKK